MDDEAWIDTCDQACCVLCYPERLDASLENVCRLCPLWMCPERSGGD